MPWTRYHGLRLSGLRDLRGRCQLSINFVYLRAFQKLLLAPTTLRALEVSDPMADPGVDLVKLAATPKKKLGRRRCRFPLCRRSFRPRRRNQRHCCAGHRVRHNLARFYDRTRRDYHVRVKVRCAGVCKYCKKPRLSSKKSDKYCNRDCAFYGKKTGRSD